MTDWNLTDRKNEGQQPRTNDVENHLEVTLPIYSEMDSVKN